MRRLAYLTSGAIALACMIVMFILRGQIGILFGASSETNGEVAKYLPLFLATLLFLSYVRVTTAYFYATEKAGLSYLLVYAEPVATFFFLLLLPRIYAISTVAVWVSVPAAQIITWCVAITAKHKVDRKTWIEV